MQKLLKCLYRDFEALNQTRLVFGHEAPGKEPARPVTADAAPEAPEAPDVTEKRLREAYSDQALEARLEGGASAELKDKFKRQGKALIEQTLASIWKDKGKGELAVGLQKLSPDSLYKRIQREIDSKLIQLAEKLTRDAELLEVAEGNLGVSGDVIVFPKAGQLEAALVEEKRKAPEGLLEEARQQWELVEQDRVEGVRQIRLAEGSGDQVQVGMLKQKQRQIEEVQAGIVRQSQLVSAQREKEGITADVEQTWQGLERRRLAAVERKDEKGAEDLRITQEALIASAKLERQKGTKFKLTITPKEGEKDIQTVVKDNLGSIFYQLMDSPTAKGKLEEFYISSLTGTAEKWDELVAMGPEKTGILVEAREAAVLEYVLLRYPELDKFNKYFGKEKRIMLCYSPQKDVFYLAGQKGKDPVVLAEAGASKGAPVEERRQQLVAGVREEERRGGGRLPSSGFERGGEAKIRGFVVGAGGEITLTTGEALTLGEMRKRTGVDKGAMAIGQRTEMTDLGAALGDRYLLTHGGKTELVLFNPDKQDYYYASTGGVVGKVESGDRIEEFTVVASGAEKGKGAGYEISREGVVLFRDELAEQKVTIGSIMKDRKELPTAVMLTHLGTKVKGYINPKTGEYYLEPNTTDERKRLKVRNGDVVVAYQSTGTDDALAQSQK